MPRIQKSNFTTALLFFTALLTTAVSFVANEVDAHASPSNSEGLIDAINLLQVLSALKPYNPHKAFEDQPPKAPLSQIQSEITKESADSAPMTDDGADITAGLNRFHKNLLAPSSSSSSSSLSSSAIQESPSSLSSLSSSSGNEEVGTVTKRRIGLRLPNILHMRAGANAPISHDPFLINKRRIGLRLPNIIYMRETK